MNFMTFDFTFEIQVYFNELIQNHKTSRTHRRIHGTSEKSDLLKKKVSTTNLMKNAQNIQYFTRFPAHI